MIANHLKIALALVSAATLLLSASSAAASAPVKEVISSRVGWKADKKTGGNICTLASGDECQAAEQSAQGDGFYRPTGIAAASNGNVYVADTRNGRVEETNAKGEFVLAFGKEVNETQDLTPGSTEAQRNVCTLASGDICKAGVEGGAPGQFDYIQSIAVDPSSSAVYVAEIVFGKVGGETTFGERVQEFTTEGKFVLEIGKGVNETTKENLCTEEEVEKSGRKCGGPAQHPIGSSPEAPEPGTITTAKALAVGGPSELLYVGEEHRVQEFDAKTGQYVSEIPLTPISSATNSVVSTLAVDKAGNAYLVYSVNFATNTIREFDHEGKEVNTVTVAPKSTETNNAALEITNIALDPVGRLAVTERESGYLTSQGEPFSYRGEYYEIGAGKLHRITGFTDEFTGEFHNVGSSDISFDGNNDLLAVVGNEVIFYTALPVAELIVVPPTCVPVPLTEVETDVKLECALKGTVNPEGVAATEAWFEWGMTQSLGQETPHECVAKCEAGVENPLPLSFTIGNLRPNSMVYYRLAGYDQNVPPSSKEVLTSETTQFATSTVPPRIVRAPTASFVKSSSAVLFSEVNPENAETEYFFEYGPHECFAVCVSKTKTLKSAAYGTIGASLEARGLQPAKNYRYRLAALNMKKEPAVDEHGQLPTPEGEFATSAAPEPQATTGDPSGIGVTSATISGTVDPDGEPATYSFEVGVYTGAGTQYGTVLLASAGASSTPVAEAVTLNGLQPGTTYAYRITLSSGYVKNETHTTQGATKTFTTNGEPNVLVLPTVLPQLLTTPSIVFPAEHGETQPRRTLNQELDKALKACAKKPKRKRAACRRNVHRRYAAHTISKSKHRNKK